MKACCRRGQDDDAVGVDRWKRPSAPESRALSEEAGAASADGAAGHDGIWGADFFAGLPDDIVVCILCRLSPSASAPSDLVNVMLTCKRLRSLRLHPLVLSKASAKSLAVRAKNWSETAQRFLKMCGDAGNLEASYILGMIQFYCLQNRGSGASLMAKAAIGYHAAALYSLAVIQFNGGGICASLRYLSLAKLARVICEAVDAHQAIDIQSLQGGGKWLPPVMRVDRSSSGVTGAAAAPRRPVRRPSSLTSTSARTLSLRDAMTVLYAEAGWRKGNCIQEMQFLFAFISEHLVFTALCRRQYKTFIGSSLHSKSEPAAVLQPPMPPPAVLLRPPPVRRAPPLPSNRQLEGPLCVRPEAAQDDGGLELERSLRRLEPRLRSLLWSNASKITRKKMQEIGIKIGELTFMECFLNHPQEGGNGGGEL